MAINWSRWVKVLALTACTTLSGGLAAVELMLLATRAPGDSLYDAVFAVAFFRWGAMLGLVFGLITGVLVRPKRLSLLVLVGVVLTLALFASIPAVRRNRGLWAPRSEIHEPNPRAGLNPAPPDWRLEPCPGRLGGCARYATSAKP